MGTATYAFGVPATCTLGTISGTTMTVAGTITGTYVVGQTVTGTGVSANTVITALGTGTGGAGTYVVNNSQTVASTALTGGRQYSSPASAYAAVPANLVTDGNSYVLHGYNDSEFVSASTLLAISGNTTDSTHTLTVNCATGQSFSDNSSAQTNALSYVAANGVAIRCTGSYTNTVTNSVDYVTISGLQIANTGAGNSNMALFASANTPNTFYDDLILESGISSTSQGVIRIQAGAFRNSLAVQRNSSSNCVYLAYPNAGLKLTNLTLVRTSNNSPAATAINWSTGVGTPAVKNCAVFGFSTFTNHACTGSNNCSDTTISFGTSNQASKTYANQFKTTTDTGRDFKLITGADCVDNGVTDTTDIPSATDAVGTSRPQGSAWDIGAWELVSSGTNVNLTGVFLTSAVGSFTPEVDYSLAGVILNSAVGNFNPTVSTTLYGVSTTTGVGAMVESVSSSLSGVSATSAVGSLTNKISVALIGVLCNTAVGKFIFANVVSWITRARRRGRR